MKYRGLERRSTKYGFLALQDAGGPQGLAGKSRSEKPFI